MDAAMNRREQDRLFDIFFYQRTFGHNRGELQNSLRELVGKI